MNAWRTFCRVLYLLFGLGCLGGVIYIITDSVGSIKECNWWFSLTGRVLAGLVLLYVSACCGIFPVCKRPSSRYCPTPWKIWKVYSECLPPRQPPYVLLNDTNEPQISTYQGHDDSLPAITTDTETSDQRYLSRRQQRRSRSVLEAASCQGTSETRDDTNTEGIVEHFLTSERKSPREQNIESSTGPNAESTVPGEKTEQCERPKTKIQEGEIFSSALAEEAKNMARNEHLSTETVNVLQHSAASEKSSQTESPDQHISSEDDLAGKMSL